MTRRITTHILAAALVAPVIGCANEVGEPTQFDKPDGSTKNEAEVWSSSDSPTLFSADLKYTLAELPRSGGPQVAPWASSYWPTYEDSINYKWDGASSESAAAKYGRAFSVSGVEDAVSAFRGIDSNSSRTTCTTSSQCKSEIGEQCAIRDGKTEGKCVPTWWGICHAWSPAAILTPEPKHAVTHNGVNFKVNDIKALVTLAHDGVVNKFVSLRCDKDDRPGAEAGDRVEFDDNGRPSDLACRDSNAGSFHVLITNYLGIQQASFVFDQTFDDEVWNQPLRDFTVQELREVTPAEAVSILDVRAVGGTKTNLAADVAQGAWKHFDAITVAAGQKLVAQMHGTGDGDMFVQFGSQATSSSYACRPYADGSEETCDLTVPAGATQAFVSVNGYSQANITVEVTVGGSAPNGYPFNNRAAKLFYARTDVRYITESSPSTDGNLASQIDRYTNTNRYEYILEVDSAGKIIGGEWARGSKRSHPDFAWLPVRIRGESVASGKISWANVKQILDLSVADEGGGGGGGGGTQKTVNESGTVAKNDMRHFGPYHVAAGTSLSAVMTGSGDADLYVRKGGQPNLSTYDCRPYKNGSSEQCTITGPGDVYVAVHGYAASSDFQLVVTYTEGGGTPPPPPPPPPAGSHLNVTGNVALNAYAYYTVPVVAGKPIVVRTTAPNDVDVYLQMGQNPTADNNLAQAYTSSGNETLRFVPSSSGTLHVGVHGYAASSFTLTTADN